MGLQVTSFTRKSRRYSSYKGKVGKVAPNRIHRHFDSHIPHQKTTTDTTEFKYYEVDEKGHLIIKKLHFDSFMDMYDSEILSIVSAIGIMTALETAIESISDCPYRRSFHSDRGWVNQMKAYVQQLKKNQIFQSMFRKENCYDNSVMENFFGIMKEENHIRYYNKQRIKQKLTWMSPVKY